MEIPTSNTPVAKCIELAAYACQTMLQLSSINPVLHELANKLNTAREKLILAEQNHANAEANMVSVRVNVTLANYAADEGLKQAKRAAQIADGESNGSIATHLFPGGASAVFRYMGNAQVKEMRDLEGRYDGLIEKWVNAQYEKEKIIALRERYEIALQDRTNAAQTVDNMRALRDLAKNDLLDTYAEVANRIRALFPRNKAKQDLFFDAVIDRKAKKSKAVA